MQGFDYATPAAYFVTICTYERRLLFEDAVLAEIVEQQWHALPQRFPTVDLDVFVVMPNHIHGILMLNTADVGAPLAGAQTLRTPTRSTSSDATEGQRAGASPAPTLGTVVGAYKSLVATAWLQWVKVNNASQSARVWQRSYYERVIRSDDEFGRVQAYIADNPRMWKFDPENPARKANVDYNRVWSWLERRER